MTRDPDYNLAVYEHVEGVLVPPRRKWLVRVHHPRTKLHMFFDGDTKQEAIDLAEAAWEQYREEREAAWAKQDAAKAARAAKSKEETK